MNSFRLSSPNTTGSDSITLEIAMEPVDGMLVQRGIAKTEANKAQLRRLAQAVASRKPVPVFLTYSLWGGDERMSEAHTIIHCPVTSVHEMSYDNHLNGLTAVIYELVCISDPGGSEGNYQIIFDSDGNISANGGFDLVPPEIFDGASDEYSVSPAAAMLKARRKA